MWIDEEYEHESGQKRGEKERCLLGAECALLGNDSMAAHNAPAHATGAETWQ
jgi:hypothetical protein